jgi:hypothetical protein
MDGLDNHQHHNNHVAFRFPKQRKDQIQSRMTYVGTLRGSTYLCIVHTFWRSCCRVDTSLIGSTTKPCVIDFAAWRREPSLTPMFLLFGSASITEPTTTTKRRNIDRLPSDRRPTPSLGVSSVTSKGTTLHANTHTHRHLHSIQYHVVSSRPSNLSSWKQSGSSTSLVPDGHCRLFSVRYDSFPTARRAQDDLRNVSKFRRQ